MCVRERGGGKVISCAIILFVPFLVPVLLEVGGFVCACTHPVSGADSSSQKKPVFHAVATNFFSCLVVPATKGQKNSFFYPVIVIVMYVDVRTSQAEEVVVLRIKE